MLAAPYARTFGFVALASTLACLAVAARFLVTHNGRGALLLIGLACVVAVQAADSLVWHGRHRRVTTPIVLVLTGVVAVAAVWLAVSEIR